MAEEQRQKMAVVPGGPVKEAVRVTVLSESGGTTLKLSDGTELFIKTVVMDAWRFIDEYDPNGWPIYQIRGGMVTSPMHVNDELKQH